jgi:hypothetical protein
MQTAPKFGLRFCRHGQNASGRWAGFFLTPIKIGPNRASAVHLCQAVGDALSAIVVGPEPRAFANVENLMQKHQFGIFDLIFSYLY